MPAAGAASRDSRTRPAPRHDACPSLTSRLFVKPARTRRLAVAESPSADGCAPETSMVVVRPIRLDEWRSYRDMRLRALQESPEAFGSTWAAEAARPDEAWAARIAAAHGSAMDRALFAVKDVQPCGLVWCKVCADEPGVADVFQMWVDPASRGQGLGSALLREAVGFARGARIATLRLGVAVAESPAMHLYRSFGFVPVGAPEPLREGSTVWAQTMHLRLDATA